MQSRLPSTVRLVDESDDTALIALQGPKAEAILGKLTDPILAKNLKYYWASETKVLGLDCYLSRTGYTGEDGFEIYLRATDAPQVWDALMESGKSDGLVPVGLGARDTLRLEMGYPLHGHELSEEITPLMAGLNWVVKLQKGDFIGRQPLSREAEHGPKRRLVALVIEDKRLAREGYSISVAGSAVGKITSGTQSPHLEAPIAMGFVDSTAAGGKAFEVDVRGTHVPARATALPFVPSHTKRVR